jgi:ADP-ribosyl-[dinitrogen reductase] hydrolase
MFGLGPGSFGNPFPQAPRTKIKNCYWVEEPWLLAGEYPGAKETSEAREKLSALLDRGVRVFVDLTEPHELVPYAQLAGELASERGIEITTHRHAIEDLNPPDSYGAMDDILDTLQRSRVAEEPVYLHCWGGTGRTGTVVSCWLISHGMDPEDALRTVNSRAREMPKLQTQTHRTSPDNDLQRRWVRKWSEQRSGPDLINRIAGAFVGLAVCDALGTTLEFTNPGAVQPITDMVGGGPFRLAAGEWTDDTSMALCLAESLIELGHHDPHDEMSHYVRWMEEGHNSVTGRCFDIGNTVGAALRRFKASGEPKAGDPSPNLAGNGALMRLAPAVLYFHREPDRALEAARTTTELTHGAPQTLAASDLFARMLIRALAGGTKSEILTVGEDGLFAAPSMQGEPYHPAIAKLARGERLDAFPDYSGGGYVVDSLRLALVAFRKSATFGEGALRAVNFGGDADTNGAIYGQLAGAHFGLSEIPTAWLDKLAWRNRRISTGEALAKSGKESRVAPP